MVIKMSENEAKKPKEDDKVLLIAQEISFAKTLACNDKRLRDRALKKLRKWLLNRARPDKPSVFSKNDMMTLWKGLFFCMWMSDKPLVQEELADNISSLILCLSHQQKAASSYIEAFFLTMREHWSSIDTFRIGKFQMLVRRILRQSLRWASKDQWAHASDIANILWSSVLSVQSYKPPPLGLGMHVCEVFLEEVAKVVGKAGISQTALSELLKPFAKCLASRLGDARLRTTVASVVFSGLIRQSDEGLEHQAKLEAWRMMGCPAVPLDQLEREECGDEEDESEETEENGSQDEELDPRAGQLDVELPQIPFEAKQIVSLLQELMIDPQTNSKARKRLQKVAVKFEDLQRGVYPLEFKLPMTSEDDLNDWNQEQEIEDAAASLQDFEQNLHLEDASLGVGKSSILKRLATLQEQAAVCQPKQPKRRRRGKGKWEVTEVSESEQPKTENGLVNLSPGTGGSWQVSPAENDTQKDWDKPLQDGEYEYFVAPRKRKQDPSNIKRKKMKSPNEVEIDTNHITNGVKEPEVTTPVTHLSTPILRSMKKQAAASTSQSTPVSRIIMEGTDNLSISVGSGKKKVAFELNRNMFQEVREYAEQLKNSPGIPHDPNRKPVQGLLKSFTPSPIRPQALRKKSIIFS